ncbi:sigma-70 family RNA polymerase sigma factor [Pseudoxanthomonas sp. CF125]|uniref:RNA polymerase sigma factor n=1 Tax=Pseudoxanthomonas sp. CF125 TaxID=1855303 RepID=UPI00087E6598|nr:sigma-70 family RNA polymerase sigma factor [Pseudoxanthomonas sp. CF125]SDQ19501.1 RNA polymerase sigma factor, sigma-70 family [Pseudoxanthomonas sp. CF125]
MNAEALDLMLRRDLPAAARGDQTAYGRIVVACQNTVTAIALAITRDVAASEDIAQEAFLKAWQQLDRLNNSASFLPWLRQITRNLARDHLRANRNRPLSGEGAEIAIQMAADPSPTPSERLLQTEQEIVAADLISSLPEESRETLLLYYREGQSSQQVASLLGLSDAAVRKRLSRARSNVREEMLKRFGEFARTTAPSAAFAVAVSGALMVAAPGASAAALIGASAVGSGAGKLGAGGLGASAVNGGVALGAWGTMFGGQLHVVLAALAGGMLGGYLGGLFLLRFADTADERRQIRGFIFMNTATAAVFSIGVLILVGITHHRLPILIYALAGMAVINYQCLVPLQRIMKPLLARDNARRGRTGTNWAYESMYGRTGVLIANMSVALAIGWALLN